MAKTEQQRRLETKRKVQAYAAAHKIEIKERKARAYQDNREKRIKNQRWLSIHNLYGLTEDDYNRIFEEQNGCCALCGKHQSDLKLTLCIDHDHETGRIRGLLCTNCNMALGLLKDNVTILQKAVEYITSEIDVR